MYLITSRYRYTVQRLFYSNEAKKIKRTYIALATIVFVGVYTTSPISYASSPNWEQAITTHQVTVDGQSVSYVRINVHDKNVSVHPVVANNTFGTTQTLADMAKHAHAIVAINGTFFNSWSNKYPSGAIEINGQFENNEKGTLLGFGQSGKMLMTRATESLSASIADTSNPYVTGLWPWYLNMPSTNSSRVDILTSYFGKKTKDQNATVINIQNNEVTYIGHGITNIPTNGYSVELGVAQGVMLGRIHIGDEAALSDTVQALDGTSIDFSKYRNAIGAGPLLVDNKQIVLNPKLEGFTDGTLINTNTRRSFAGIDSGGDLILGTIHSATLSQEAKIVKDLKLNQAMNLDGGSSTGLYFDGRYLTQPGRALSNALVVTYN